jgi:hypothetical protein
MAKDRPLVEILTVLDQDAKPHGQLTPRCKLPVIEFVGTEIDRDRKVWAVSPHLG